MPDARPRLGISACLLGEAVRFDGQHKHDGFLTGTLGDYVTWVSVCPEVEAGMGTPREPVRLVDRPEGPIMVGVNSGDDWTSRMRTFSADRADQLAAMDLDGFVLKKDSPSCGMERVRVYPSSGEGSPSRDGRGLFAAALLRRLPLLPAEEEGRLNDPGLRENFIERIFAYHRWRRFLADDPGPGDLVAFHTAHKLALSAHDDQRYRALGRLVATAGSADFDQLLDAYGEGFMEALRAPATRKKHANALYHLLGYLKDALDAEDRQELVELIERYRTGQVPLIVPMTLFQHHFRRHPDEWVGTQTYLAPYPAELMLRNHV